MPDSLVIRGAREHNLQNVSLELPRDQLIVFTGLSGSGKSSLAFDTIYAEGQRRYVESLSSYARQFLGQMDKPDVDFIEGLSPAISIDQKSASRNPRSTVGTITEVYDYLRLLYARIGLPHCPKCGRLVSRQSPQQIVDRVMDLADGTRFHVLAPVVKARKGEYDALLDDLASQGYARARIDGELVELGGREKHALARYEQHTIAVVVDRLVHRPGVERRLTDSIETALRLGEGVAEIQLVDTDEILTFSQHLACATDGISFEDPAPRNFSFNSPFGACPVCLGLGTRFEVDPSLVIPNPVLSLDHGAIAPWASSRTEYFSRVLRAVGESFGIDLTDPWSRLTKAQQKVILYGSGDRRVHVSYRNRYGTQRSYNTTYEGVIPWLGRRHGEAESDWQREQVEGYMREVPCAACEGTRLRPESLAVTVDGMNIAELAGKPIGEALKVISSLELSGREAMIAERLLKEIRARVQFLVDVPRRGRGAAYPARQPDRLGSRRRALRARRAIGRAPPAGQPASHRDAGAPAGPRQYGDRRRARRGDDPRCRPRRRHRPGGGRARWGDCLLGAGRRPPARTALGDGQVPLGRADDPGAETPPQAGARPPRRA
jgi:excinuclease ABC subunit A